MTPASLFVVIYGERSLKFCLLLFTQIIGFKRIGITGALISQVPSFHHEGFICEVFLIVKLRKLFKRRLYASRGKWKKYFQ